MVLLKNIFPGANTTTHIFKSIYKNINKSFDETLTIGAEKAIWTPFEPTVEVKVGENGAEEIDWRAEEKPIGAYVVYP